MQKIGFCERYMLTTAVLKRFKTNTRRLEKALQRVVTEYEKKWEKPFSIVSQYYDKGFDKIGICTPNEPIYFSTRYKLGEVVAVAQSYKSIHEEMTNGDYGDSKYDAFRCAMVANTPGWYNKMFVRPDLMPHQIQITGVRIERLQDITDEDCLKEGVIRHMDSCGNCYYYVKGMPSWCFFPREAFAALINRPRVGRPGLWESNPFVVVYEFKLIK